MSRRASGILLFRRRGQLQVFLARRSANQRRLAGYHGFLSGVFHDGDETLVAAGDVGADEERRARLGCAARVLLAQAGILPLHRSRPVTLDLDRLRRLAASARPPDIRKELQAAGASLAVREFQLGPRRVDPHCYRQPLDIQWFVMETETHEPSPPAGGAEIEEGRWWRPGEALEAWESGQILLEPDAVDLLRLARDRGAGAWLESREPADFDTSERVLSWLPGVDILPVPTPPLPETLPCNVFLLGTRRFIVVDPGPRKEGPRRHLVQVVERRIEAGDRLEAVVLTHHHQDHSGAVEVVTERFGTPLWAHAITGRLIGRSLDRALEDGDEIDLGEAPDGNGKQTLRCVFTPGHAEGHLVLLESRYRALIAGDLVSTLVSMYVGSPGGRLSTYFRSIERVKELKARLLFPSHGIPTLTPDDLLDRTLQHARRRLAFVREQLTGAPVSVAELARHMYDDASPELRPMFERSTRAKLEFLAERGEARRVGDELYVWSDHAVESSE